VSEDVHDSNNDPYADVDRIRHILARGLYKNSFLPERVPDDVVASWDAQRHARYLNQITHPSEADKILARGLHVIL
jgi:hypothetical protein